MGKTRISVSLSTRAFNILDEVSKKGFNNNISALIEYVALRINPQLFYKFMAKYHCAEMNKFRDLVIEIEKRPDVQKELKELMIQ